MKWKVNGDLAGNVGAVLRSYSRCAPMCDALYEVLYVDIDTYDTVASSALAPQMVRCSFPAVILLRNRISPRSRSPCTSITILLDHARNTNHPHTTLRNMIHKDAHPAFGCGENYDGSVAATDGATRQYVRRVEATSK